MKKILILLVFCLSANLYSGEFLESLSEKSSEFDVIYSHDSDIRTEAGVKVQVYNYENLIHIFTVLEPCDDLSIKKGDQFLIVDDLCLKSISYQDKYDYMLHTYEHPQKKLHFFYIKTFKDKQAIVSFN